MNRMNVHIKTARKMWIVAFAVLVLIFAAISLSANSRAYAEDSEYHEVTGEWNVTENTTIGQRVLVNGNVTINISEGSTLTCERGISVRSGNSLTINGPGTLRANRQDLYDKSMYPYAGIGGDPTTPDAGTIVINSGTVNARGGYNSAAIGGGAGGSGGTITINGGNVTAFAADEGAPIGAGQNNGYYDVTINGGRVSVDKRSWSSYNGSAAIGAGGTADGSQVPPTANGTIRINGGQVIVASGHIGSGSVNNVGSNRIELSWTNPDDRIEFPNCVFSNNVIYKKPFFDDSGKVINPGTYKGSGGAYTPDWKPTRYGNRTPALYTVNYYTTENELYHSEKVQVGNKATAPEDPTWEKALSLLGWYRSWHDAEKDDYAEDATDRFDFNANITQNLNLYAGWERKSSVYHYPADNEDVIKRVFAPYGADYTLPDPKDFEGFTPPEGKAYAGWNWKDSGDYAGDIGTKIKVTAKELALKGVVDDYYDVTYKAGDGTGVDKNSILIKGRNLTLPDNKDLEDGGFTAPEHKEFDCWDVYVSDQQIGKKNAGDEITPDGNVELVAQWKYVKHTVTFRDGYTEGDAGVIDTQQVQYGSAATAPEDPTREHYVFDGWDKDFSEITGDLTVNAKWKLEQHLISFVSDGEVIQETSFDYGTEKASIEDLAPTPQKDPDAQYTYEFAGWDPEFADVTEDATYTAKYTKTVNKYTVTFRDGYTEGDAGVLDTQVVEYGSPATAPKEPAREHYIFNGWDKAFSEIKGDLTVSARWKPVQHVIRFMDDDGEVIQEAYFDYGTTKESLKELAPKPNKPADERYMYVFAGWDPELADVKEDAGYKATYTKKPVPARKVSGTLLAKATAKGSKSLNISWTRVQNADGYDIFLAGCNANGKKYSLKRVKTVKGNKTFKWTKTGLKKKASYKAYVKAYVIKKGKKSYVRTSPTIHVYTSNVQGKYTNARSVTVNRTNVTLKKGKTFTAKARVNKIKKSKRLMPKNHAPTVRYVTSNSRIAVVNGSGRITAGSTGTCYVYVLAHNGVSKQIKITVK